MTLIDTFLESFKYHWFKNLRPNSMTVEVTLSPGMLFNLKSFDQIIQYKYLFTGMSFNF